MASFSAGTTFTDGVANDVTAAKLAALVNAATPTSGLIQDRTAETTIDVNDTLLVGDASDSNNLKRMTVANFAGTLPTATITSGTITNLASTTGTIATLNSTTGTIGTINSTTGTIATLNSTTGTIATLNSTTGTIATLNSTTGTITTLNSTTGTITTGVIPTLTSTTLITTGTGTAASPAIVPTGDTNTGIFFPAADTIAFSEGGAEAMRIDSSGNVGIGSIAPNAKLFVISGSYPNSAQFLIGYLGGSENYYDANTQIFRNGNAEETMRINSSGVTIATLAGAGSRSVNASAAGLLSAASDASLKEEVVGAHIAGLAEILKIHPKMYRWKDDIANRGNEAAVELGFIANDVAPIIPSAAPMGNDGLYGFYDRSITAALVKAVQELKAENDSLKSRIEALEAK